MLKVGDRIRARGDCSAHSVRGVKGTVVPDAPNDIYVKGWVTVDFDEDNWPYFLSDIPSERLRKGWVLQEFELEVIEEES